MSQPNDIDRQALFSSGQLARLLGISRRTLYRWEQESLIDQPQRINRGPMSIRVYTGQQAEVIREKMKDRIAATDVILRRENVSAKTRRVVKARRRAAKPAAAKRRIVAAVSKSSAAPTPRPAVRGKTKGTAKNGRPGQVTAARG